MFQVGTKEFGNTDMRPFRRKEQTGKKHPIRKHIVSTCVALTLARCLALQVDTPVGHGWLAWWTLGHFSFFLPRDDLCTKYWTKIGEYDLKQ